MGLEQGVPGRAQGNFKPQSTLRIAEDAEYLL